MRTPSDILTVGDLDLGTIASLCVSAEEFTRNQTGTGTGVNLSDQTVALLFSQPSTRTRLGFEAGMAYLGGRAIALTGGDAQVTQGHESVSDAARVISTFVDAIVLRIGDHRLLERVAQHATVPVINALSDRGHPCEALADLSFLLSRYGTLSYLALTWVGDCTNVAFSVASVCVMTGVEVRVACPPAYRFDKGEISEIRSLGPGSFTYYENPVEAVTNTDVVYTDRWTSMGLEAEREARGKNFQEYQVNQNLLSHAPDAVVMHCLPATRDEEITTAVLEGNRSAVWDQAATRLPMQQALLTYVWKTLKSLFRTRAVWKAHPQQADALVYPAV